MGRYAVLGAAALGQAMLVGVLGNVATDVLKASIMTELIRDMAIAIAWIGLVATGFVFAWKVPWDRFIPAVSAPVPNQYAPSGARNMTPTDDTSDDIAEVIDFQRRNLHAYVVVSQMHVDSTGLSTPSPYLDFTFTVQNFSVFNIFLEGDVEGHIEYDDGTRRISLSQTPEFQNPRIGRRQTSRVLGQPDQLFVTLRQYLNDTTRSDLQARRASVGHIDFFLEGLTVWIGGTNDNTPLRSRLQLATARW